MQVGHVYTCSKILQVLSSWSSIAQFFLRPQIKITNKIMVVLRT